ncbi:hypothetical protein [Rudaeicoccus suwonensis]|nr:hypothetical protein [Rudaeicoccus suwonensis]
MTQPTGPVRGGVLFERGRPEQVLGDPQEERTRRFLSRFLH